MYEIFPPQGYWGRRVEVVMSRVFAEGKIRWSLPGVAVTVLGWGAALVFAPGVPMARAATASAAVYVVVAVDDSAAQVFIDGTNVASPAQSPVVVGPFHVSAGNHTVTIRRGGHEDVQAQFAAPAHSSLDVVAHPFADANKKPVVTVFPNDHSAVGVRQGRVAVANVGVLPPLDVTVAGQMQHSIAGGQSSAATVGAGSTSWQAVVSGSGATVFSPSTLTVAPGSFTRLYLTTDTAGKVRSAPLVHTIPVAGQATGTTSETTKHGAQVINPPSATPTAAVTSVPSAKSTTMASARSSVPAVRPSRVSTGDGGQAAAVVSRSARSWWWLAVAAVAAGVSVLWWRNRRSAGSPVLGARHGR